MSKVTFEFDALRDQQEILEKLKSSAIRRLVEDLGKEMKNFRQYGSESLTYPYFNKHKPIKNARQMADYVLQFIYHEAGEEGIRSLFCY